MGQKGIKQQTDDLTPLADGVKELEGEMPWEEDIADAQVMTLVPMENPTSPIHLIPYKWKDVQDGWRCVRCGIFDIDKDEMILHVLTHYPDLEEEGREELLNKLLKE